MMVMASTFGGLCDGDAKQRFTGNRKLVFYVSIEPKIDVSGKFDCLDAAGEDGECGVK